MIGFFIRYKLTTKSNALEETNKRFKEVQEQISKYIDPNVTEKIFKGERGDALACLRMALEMQMKMKTLQEKWWNQGIQFPFEIRCGIHTGMANVGNYGSDGFMEYSAIGLNTNLAARLEKACQPGDIYISHTSWALVNDEIPCEEVGTIEVKGFHYPTN